MAKKNRTGKGCLPISVEVCMDLLRKVCTNLDTIKEQYNYQELLKK